ncbi:unnamed protein product [Boreogadus saida]
MNVFELERDPTKGLIPPEAHAPRDGCAAVTAADRFHSNQATVRRAPGDGHRACFRCLGADHAAAALVAPTSCATFRTLPEEGLLSRHLFFSPSVDLAEAINIFGAEVPDAQDADERFEVDDVASLDDVFPGSASEFSRSGASTEATIVPRERPRRMADLFGKIKGEAAAIKGIPTPALPLAPMSDDMQGECFRTLSSSWRVTQCPLFPPVQHLLKKICALWLQPADNARP